MNMQTLSRRALIATSMVMASAQSALAQVEIPTLGGAFEDDDDLVTTTRNLVTEFLEIGLILVGVVIFIVVGWAVVKSFYECVSGRKEWGEAGVTIGGGVAAIVVAGILLTIGSDVLPGGAQ